MYCPSCRGDIPLGVRFCNHCGAPTGSELMRGGAAAADDPEATRVAGQDPADPEATRFAGRDSEATRVAARSPFDDRRGAPSRVEQLPDRDSPRALEQSSRAPRPRLPPRPPPRGAATPNTTPSASSSPSARRCFSSASATPSPPSARWA